MPQQPTQEQFDAAAKRVMESAPPGLSQEQFFAAIDKALAGGYETDEGTRGAITKSIARQAGGIIPTQAVKDENGKDVNSTVGPGVLRNFLSNTIRSPIPNIAHPTGVGDLLPYALPASPGSEMAPMNLLRGFKRVVSSGAKEVATGPVSSSPIRFVRGASRALKEGPPPAIDHFTPNLPADAGGEFGPSASGVGKPESIIDRYMPNTSSAEAPAMAVSHEKVPYGGPDPAAGVDPRVGTRPAGLVVGKAPSLEDALTQVIDQIRAESPSAPVSTLPSDLGTAGEGAIKQSGKFGKSGALGQPGGYSSGRPAISDKMLDDYHARQNFGSRGEESVGVDSPAPADAGAAPAAEGKPRVTTSEALQYLRRQAGSKEAARRFYGSGSKPFVELVKSHAPGPSRLPAEAEDRIQEALMKMMEEKDQ